MSGLLAPLFAWWLVIQLIGLLAWPLTRYVFRNLPDGGYAFAKPFGLLLVGYGAWLLAMFGLGAFGLPLIVLVAVAVAVAGGFVWRATRAVPLPSRLRPGTILAYEAVFVLALFFVAWMRSYNPDPWGTERPMDFAFFNAIQQSPTFPPLDPWLAGYSINYYYFGYLLLAVPALLSGLDPAVNYNLALALTYALAAQGIAGLLLNLVWLLPRAGQAPAAGSETAPVASSDTRPRRRPLAWLAAVLGVVFVLVAGNQAGALQVLVGDHRVVALDTRQLLSALAQRGAGAEQIELPYPVQAMDFGEFATIEPADRVADFNWWWPSRALWDAYAQRGGERVYNITEFPFFSFWLGDMHPHVMALPWGLLAMALALTTLAAREPPAFARGWRGWIDLAAAGLILGSLYVINSWDLPTYVLLFAGAFLLSYLRPADPARPLPWLLIARRFGLLVVALVVLFAPFYLTFRSLVGAADPLVDLPIIGRLTSTIAPFVGSRSDLAQFLSIFGLFLLPLVAFAYLAARRDRPDSAPPAQAAGFMARSASFGEHVAATAFLPLLPPILLVLGLLVGFPLLALLGLGLFALHQALRQAAWPARAFAYLGLALGCAVVFGTELIFIRDVFGTRMNTIFKFYYQVWLIWGVLAAYALWWLLTQTRAAARLAGVAVALVTFVLLAGALVYPVINLRNQVDYGLQVGLAGKTPRTTSPAGAAAVEWLRQHAPPGSVVLEMVGPTGGSYSPEGYGGVSASTGLPTVLGWVGHQQQWRGGDPAARAEIEPRREHVDRIYRTEDPATARELLRQYNVDYVYIGALERQNYAPAALAKFNVLGRLVFQQDDVEIYRIQPEVTLR